MKKKIIALALAGLLCCSLFGCGGSAKVSADTLVVWEASLQPEYEQILAISPNDPASLLTKLIVDKFEAENPGKKLALRFNGWGETLNKNVTNLLITDMGVDIVPGEQYISPLIEGGTFEPLDDKYRSIVSEDLIARGVSKKDGRLYAVPMQTGACALYINKAVLRQAKIIDKEDKVIHPEVAAKNINPLAPATMEDLLFVCQKIKAFFNNNNVDSKGGFLLNDTTKGGGSQWRALAFMRQAGGDFADDDGNVTFDSAANRKAFEMMYQLSLTRPEGSQAATEEDVLLNKYFYESRAAYVVEGPNCLFNAAGTLAAKDIVSCEMPVFEGVNIKSNVSMGTVYYSIMANSKKKDLAKRYFDVITSEEVQMAIMKYIYAVPTVKSVLAKEELKTDEYHYSDLQTTLIPYQDPSYVNVKPLYGFSNNAAQIWDTWLSFTSRAFTNPAASVSIDSLVKETHDAMVKQANRA